MTAGGKERRLTELMKALKKLPEFEFELALMSRDIHYDEVFRLGIRIHFILRETRRDINAFISYYKLLREFKPDIVHCWDSMTAVYVTPFCRLLGIKLVNGMIVDTQIRQSIRNKYLLRARLTFPFADVVVGNSMTGLKSYRAPTKKSVCIYNGIDLSRLDRVKDRSLMLGEILGDVPENVFVVGMVAAFEPRKDYDTLIKASVLLAESFDNIRFVYVGDGINRQRSMEKVPAKPGAKISFLGKRADIESIVNCFDVGVLITNSKIHGEGISNSIIEYMALAKPVIATSGGGTNEIVHDNQNGFLIDPEDSGQLTEKILLLMNDRSLGKRLGQEGEKMIREKFDLKIMTRNYVELYKNLINS